MSDNKVKEIFRSKQGDGFDQGYNATTYMEFYQPGDRFSEIFYDAASQLSSLHRYLEYSRRYIRRYLEEGAACEKQLFDDGAAAEEEILYDETFGADKKYLLRYNDESVFLMIYTLFESFVHRLVEEQEREQHLDFKSRNYQGSMIARYTAFLKEFCHMNIVFEDAPLGEVSKDQEDQKRLYSQQRRGLPKCLSARAGAGASRIAGGEPAGSQLRFFDRCL